MKAEDTTKETKMNPYWEIWSKVHYNEVLDAGNQYRIPVYIQDDLVYFETENSRVYDKGCKVGIKKIVDWINTYEDKDLLIDDDDNPIATYMFNEFELQSKLKEWGI